MDVSSIRVKSGFFLNLAKAIDTIIFIGSLVFGFFWIIGRPLFYSDQEPVFSAFTALSLLIMSGVRLARTSLYGWPPAISMALLGLVIGGNLSSILMQTTLPINLMASFPSIVLTSVMTSFGLILYCTYEILIIIRETPRSIIIVDDILLHLALVPGGLSLLGHLLNAPLYMSTLSDPRVGIGIPEMLFFGLYAVSAVLSNRHLFLFQFLRESFTNRVLFAILFANQFIAPIIVAWVFLSEGPVREPGIELFVMLAGVLSTVTFLFLQAKIWPKNKKP